MRVLIVINGLGTGGAERSLRETLPLLVERGIDPVVTCLFHRTEGVETAVLDSGQRVEFLRGTSWPARLRSLSDRIGTLRPDLVHTTIFEADLLGRLAARPHRVPVLTSLVNTSYADVRREDPRVRPWKLEIARRVDAVTARRLTTHFHAITHAVKDAAVQSLGIDPGLVTVVERGRDPQRLGEPGQARRATGRASLGLPDNAEVILTVGRQEYQKAQIDLIRAFVASASTRPRLHLILAGRRGNASDDIDAELAAMRHRDRVHMLGHREDVPDLLATADVFAFPSQYEGLGGAVIEAMAMGLPVVATRIPALEEVLDEGRNADLVSVGDDAALASCVELLLEDPERLQRYGARSRAIFEQRFTLERSAGRMATLYRALAARP